MQTMLPGHTVSDKDAYEGFLSRKGPAVVADFLDESGDFARHLRRLTPMGAPALRCWADWEPEPCPLPLVEPLNAPAADAREGSDWMVRALSRIQYRDKPLREIDKTAQFLAPATAADRRTACLVVAPRTGLEGKLAAERPAARRSANGTRKAGHPGRRLRRHSRSAAHLGQRDRSWPERPRGIHERRQDHQGTPEGSPVSRSGKGHSGRSRGVALDARLRGEACAALAGGSGLHVLARVLGSEGRRRSEGRDQQNRPIPVRTLACGR
jgi:hypothetical protein